MHDDGRLNLNDHKRNTVKKLNPAHNSLHFQLRFTFHARNSQHPNIPHKIILHN